ncbi:Putative methylthioribose-1-phosphate isomerase [Candidatus Norongarragalina meridionalis]|nr:Putative methylthioribose-1-phosphate isomerase [Candidatus Norongarragalina meridionalis]
MLVGKKPYRTVWWERGTVKLVDQNLLPFSFRIASCKTFRETARAIENMTVRGAPAIGAAAGFAMAQAVLAGKTKEGEKLIKSTRPTAVDLFHAVERVANADDALEEAQTIADESAEACERIGKLGEKLCGARILTHCNAGWLACVDWGTALAPIYMRHRHGKRVFVYVDETRPRSQGARLTAWELRNEGVAHAIIADNAAAYFMKRGEIDCVFVGADRIAKNGDFANKIGTLEKAICAREFNVPFYVCAPSSTFDRKCANGDKIRIEERDEGEVLYQRGLCDDGKIRRVRVCSPKSHARNPAFDVTPAKLVTAYVTERGVFRSF